MDIMFQEIQLLKNKVSFDKYQHFIVGVYLFKH